MNAKEAIKNSIGMGDHVAQTYLEDMTDAELLVRPVPGANHIAWQLGHLVASEHQLIEWIAPGSMPKLPEGFKEKHSKEASSSDNPKDFLTKAEYLKLLKQQREGTLAALAKMSDDDLSQPSPEKLRPHWKTVGEVFAMQGGHMLMHAGQWAVVRRKLGRKPLF